MFYGHEHHERKTFATEVRSQMKGAALRLDDDGQAAAPGTVWLDLVFGSHIPDIMLMVLSYELCLIHGWTDGNGVARRTEVRFPFRAVDVRPVEEPRPTYRLTLAWSPPAPYAAKETRDLESAFHALIDEAQRMGGPAHAWCEEIAQIIFYHPAEGGTRCEVANASLAPLEVKPLSQIFTGADATEPVALEQFLDDADAAFDDCAAVPDEIVLGAMERAQDEERLAAAG